MKEPKPIPKEYTEDFNWAYEHYSEWTRSYPDMWVAVANKEVVVTSKDLGEVKKIAHQKVDREDIPYIFIEAKTHVY
ncbi:MAG: DUF5678 domain-containing protein [bacterium]